MSSATESLCKSCGLCCDGSLFGKVPLRPNEDDSVLRSLGVPIIDTANERFFKQPCPSYEGKLCNIYLQRPQTCCDFKCLLLRRYEQQEITYDEARALIDMTVKQRDALCSDLRSLSNKIGQSVRNLYQSLEDAPSNSEPRSDAKRRAILLDYVTLMHRFSRYFGVKEHKETQVRDAMMES
jgi:hypothetical protein